MKKVNVFNKLNVCISPDNLKTEEELDGWKEFCIANHSWGKPERWVRAKYEVTIDDSIDLPPVTETIYPDEEYNDEDILETEYRPDFFGSEETKTWVKLKAEYTIEIEDYNPVPKSVSPMQIRLALNQLGLRQIIEDAVASGSQDLKDMWEFATEFKRDYPLLIQLGIDLEITPEEIDNIFRLAVTK